MSLSELASRCEALTGKTKADLRQARAELVRDASLVSGVVHGALEDPAEWIAVVEVYGALFGTQMRDLVNEQVADKKRARAEAAEKAVKAARRIESDAAESVGDSRTLDMMQRGAPRKDGSEPLLRNDYNLGVILRYDPRLAGRLRFNEFRNEEEIRGGTDQRSMRNPAGPGKVWRSLVDVDDINLCRWVSEVYRLDYKTKSAQEQVMSCASENRVHPVRAYLRATKWDRVPRLDRFLFDCFGVVAGDESERATIVAVGRAWLVSMVARVEDPGCKVDTVPVLRGVQGAMKSATLRAMMADESWFFDSDLDLRSKDKYQILPGHWLLELAEFDRYAGKADAAEIKAYVSSQADTFRGSYARRVASVPRQCVFCATVNAPQFLTDSTGARRFWPMECGACNPILMAEIRDQLWAEAFEAYGRGENWWLSKDAAQVMSDSAEAYRIGDPWEDRVSGWLASRLVQITAADVLTECLEMDLKDVGKSEQMRVTAILHREGWTRHKGRGQTTWRPPRREVREPDRKRAIEDALRQPALMDDDGRHL